MKKILSNRSKRAQEFINNYLRSTDYSLDDCYKQPSWNKENAEYNCRQKMYEECGKNFKIMSHSHFYFTCGWQVGTDLRVETPCNSYQILDALPF